MKKETIMDVRAFIRLYNELKQRYSELEDCPEAIEKDIFFLEYVEKGNIFDKFSKEHNCSGAYDRRFFIDKFMEPLCQFEKMILAYPPEYL